MARKAGKNKRDEGARNKATRTAAVNRIKELKGMKIAQLSSKEKEDLLIVICQLLGISDDKGQIN